MSKDSKGKCESPSHKLLKEKSKTRVEYLQAIFTNLQSARKESRTDDIATLEEVNKMLQEWKAELNEPSPASSLLVRNHNFVVALVYHCVLCTLRSLL